MLAFNIACLSMMNAIIFLITTNPNEEVMKKLVRPDYEYKYTSPSSYNCVYNNVHPCVISNAKHTRTIDADVLDVLNKCFRCSIFLCSQMLSSLS